MSSFYLWAKVLHVLAVISWMAGMLYLPRLFVYHADAPPGSSQAHTFATMEERLMRVIMLPAMLMVWATGLFLAMEAGFFQSSWLHAKLALVVGLTAMHGFFAILRKDLAKETNRYSARFFRMVNEGPTVLMIGIVFLVIFKPF